MQILPVRQLGGSIEVPGDKSISHRAIMLGAIAQGLTRVSGVLRCDDCDATVRAFRSMGIAISEEGGQTHIEGRGLRGLVRPAGPLEAGESGTTMRILPGILAGQDFEATLSAAPSLARRPMQRIVEPLAAMGVAVTSAGGYPPLTVRGGVVRPVTYRLPVPSAQVKSAVLFAGLYARGVTTVEEEFRSRDHTERMMAHFGARVRVEGTRVSVEGGTELAAKDFTVPGDVSSASFFLAAATILGGSKVRVAHVSMNPTRSGIIACMAEMGARFTFTDRHDACEPSADIEAVSARTHGITVEASRIPSLIDELPILFVVAAFSAGRTVVRGIGELRVKETDRVRSMQENLRAMGARFDVDGDTIAIEGGGALRGAALRSFGDHRTCMAMTVAALAARGASTMDGTACVSKSYPDFFGALGKLRVP